MVPETVLSSLIASVYDAALDPERWIAFLQGVGEAVQAEATALLYHDFTNPLGTVAASFRVDPETQSLYAAHFGRLDPWIKSAESKGILRPGVVHIGEELISHAALIRTEYYS